MKKSRILLVSDMHYTTELTYGEMKAINPGVNASIASGPLFGFTQKQKLDMVYDSIIREYEKEPLDLILVLGDLSIDDWNFRNLPDNYCKKFKDEYLARFPAPAFVLAGNHDSYPDEIWKDIFGTHRQHTVIFGDCAFIMLDVYPSPVASSASGSVYKGVDAAFLESEIEKNRDKKIFLCTHMFDENREPDEVKKLIRENQSVVCVFRGHTHNNDIIKLDAEYGGKYLFDIGGFAYNGMVVDGKYTFGMFDERWAYGYQILEINNSAAGTYHTKIALRYHAINGDFDVPLISTPKVEIKLT